jgi:hypothetical protein
MTADERRELLARTEAVTQKFRDLTRFFQQLAPEIESAVARAMQW